MSCSSGFVGDVICPATLVARQMSAVKKTMSAVSKYRLVCRGLDMIQYHVHATALMAERDRNKFYDCLANSVLI